METQVAQVVSETHMLDLFQQGGWVMYPLAFFSLLTWIITIQKVLSLKFFANEVRDLYKEADSLIRTGRLQDFAWNSKKASPIIAQVHDVIFSDDMGSKEENHERLARRLDAVNDHLKKGVWVLGTIASITPFVGLFGTVMGIMESFKSIGQSGKAGFGVVSVGISEALIATAGGIIIAVFALGFYNFVNIKIQKTYKNFKNKVEDMAQLVTVLAYHPKVQTSGHKQNQHYQPEMDETEYMPRQSVRSRVPSHDNLPPVPNRMHMPQSSHNQAMKRPQPGAYNGK